MHAAFNIVLWVVCGVSFVIAVAALLVSRKTWSEFGRATLLMDRESSREPPPGSAQALAERDAEIRQLLEARNARRERRGEAPVDVDRELARLTEPKIDPALRDEIRQLVEARNHRRIRSGKPPLDVEAEIEREIAGLSGL